MSRHRVRITVDLTVDTDPPGTEQGAADYATHFVQEALERLQLNGSSDDTALYGIVRLGTPRAKPASRPLGSRDPKKPPGAAR